MIPMLCSLSNLLGAFLIYKGMWAAVTDDRSLSTVDFVVAWKAHLKYIDLTYYYYPQYTHLLHRYECFTEKQTTRIFHTKLHSGYEWDIFHILTSEDIADVIPLFFLCFSSNFFFFYFTKQSYLCNKKKLHVGLKIWSLSSRGKKISLEDKLHIFALSARR